MKKALDSIKTIGTSGQAAVHTLSGKEIDAWVQKGVETALCRDSGILFERLRVLSSWLSGLRDHLLGKGDWTDENLQQFTRLVEDIHQNWSAMTGRRPTPKVHMLKHIVEFARRWRAVGRFSEAELEAAHAKFNREWSVAHRNSSRKPLQRLQRSLVSCILPQMARANAQNCNSTR